MSDSTNSSDTENISTHSRFVCELCLSDFSTKQYLHMHMKIVHEKCCCKKKIVDGILPELKTCKKCVTSYLRRTCVHEHKTKCGNWKPCGRAFLTTRGFKAHFENVESRFCQAVVDKYTEMFQ